MVGCQEFPYAQMVGGGSSDLPNSPQLEAMKAIDFTWTVTDKIVFNVEGSSLFNQAFTKDVQNECLTNPASSVKVNGSRFLSC